MITGINVDYHAHLSYSYQNPYPDTTLRRLGLQALAEQLDLV